MQAFDRPGLFTFGIVVTVLHALFCLAVTTFALFGVALGAGVATVVFPPMGFLVGAGGFLFVGLFWAFYAAVLWVTWRAWEGSRPWIWALIVGTFIGMVNTGPVNLLIGILTLVGSFQALDRLQRAPRTT